MTTSTQSFRRFFKKVTGQAPRYVAQHAMTDAQLAVLDKKRQLLKRSARARRVSRDRQALPDQEQ